MPHAFRRSKPTCSARSRGGSSRSIEHAAEPGVLACTSEVAPPPGRDDGHASVVDQPFSTTPSEPNHEEVTAAGLAFLRPEIVTATQAANVATDVQFVLSTANHFDGSNFTGGAAVVRDNEASAVASLDPAAVSPESDAAAIVSFGRAIHAVQDFYAHSNWVELGRTELVDASLGAFPAPAPRRPHAADDRRHGARATVMCRSRASWA